MFKMSQTVEDFLFVLRCTERQTRVTPKELQKLAQDLGVSVEWNAETVDDKNNLYIGGTAQQDAFSVLRKGVMTKYRKRYEKTELFGTREVPAPVHAEPELATEPSEPKEQVHQDANPKTPDPPVRLRIVKERKKTSRRRSRRRAPAANLSA
jgi:hypothetical protein